MLQLYFSPMACSLASRIALMEAGVEARYHLVHLRSKRIAERDADFWAISSKGAVPVLVLADGERLSENAAVLQYIADLRPELGLAPRQGELDRYRLQEWLSFVGSELHKGFLFPTFWYGDDAAKAKMRERVERSLTVAAAHLEERAHLVGGSFTVADAYLAWALMLMGRCDIEIARWPSLDAYLRRMLERPQLAAAVAVERELRKTLTS